MRGRGLLDGVALGAGERLEDASRLRATIHLVGRAFVFGLPFLVDAFASAFFMAARALLLAR